MTGNEATPFRAGLDSRGVQTLVQDKDLTVRWLPGGGDRLVVAFTGAAQKLGGMSGDEFAASASDGQRNHVLFIGDPGRSFYSIPGLRDRIATFVLAFVADKGITDLRAIGNSMGGFGAVLFAGMLPFKAVAAFSPVISMADDILCQPEWNEYRGALGADLVADTRPIMAASAAQFYLTFGDGSADDRRHIAAVPDRPNVHLTVVPGQGHNVTGWIRSECVLTDLVAAKLRCDTPTVARISADLCRLARLAAIPARNLTQTPDHSRGLT